MRISDWSSDVCSSDLPEEAEPPRRPTPFSDLVAKTGEATINIGREALRLVGFFGMLTMKVGRVVVQPRRLRGVSFVHHMEATGVTAMPIVRQIGRAHV